VSRKFLFFHAQQKNIFTMNRTITIIVIIAIALIVIAIIKNVSERKRQVIIACQIIINKTDNHFHQVNTDSMQVGDSNETIKA
jgi:hypothetical protein